MTIADIDLLVIGGGPAGLAAAVAARSRGIRSVVVFEREEQAGGVPRHCGHPPWGLWEFGRVMTGPKYASTVVKRALSAGVVVKTSTTAIALREGGEVSFTDELGLQTVKAKRVLLATGVREKPRSARLVSGDRPLGVMNTGAFQSLIYLQNMLPFKRPLIVGTELVGLSAIMTARKAGIRPVAMIESAERPTARWPLTMYPGILGIPLLLRTRLIEIVGKQRVERAIISRGESTASVDEIACDGILFTGQFVPESALIVASHLKMNAGSNGPSVDQDGRCSDEAYFAAGNVLRPVETGGWCYREGWKTGLVVAGDLQRGDQSSRYRRVAVRAGKGIKLVVPDILSLGNSQQPCRLQLRATSEVTGTLCLRTADGRLVASKWLSTRPERRILLDVKTDHLSHDCRELIVGFE